MFENFWLYLGVGFFIGVVIMFVALLTFPMKPNSRVGRFLRRLVIKSLHGVTNAEAQEVSAILLGTERIASEDIDRREGRVYVGDCACDCGQKIYYSGRGKRPKYVNRKHQDFARGFRTSWE